MTNSGLIVFLPLVAAFVGAIIGAVATGLVRAWQDKKARDLERKGLLILICTEVLLNNNVFELFVDQLDDHPDDDDRASVAALLRREVWNESKVRLAQLLPSIHIATLAFYYSALETERIKLTSPSEEPSADSLLQDARSAREVGKKVIIIAQHYISDPTFVNTLSTASGSGSPEDSKEADPT